MATSKVVVGQSNISVGQLQDLFRQIGDGSLDREDMQAFLEHRDPWARPEKVNIGIHPSQAYEALLEQECHVEYNELPVSMIPLAEAKDTINLVYVSMKDLGFDEDTPYSKVLETALKRGHTLCPAEVGPALRLRWKKQKEADWCFVGMEPVDEPQAGDPYPLIYSLGFDPENEWPRVFTSIPVDEADIGAKATLVFMRP